MNRREFLKALGAGALAAAVPKLVQPEPEIVEPVRKLWFVPSSAPVGSRVERLGGVGITAKNAHDFRLALKVTEEDLADAKYPELINMVLNAKPAFWASIERDLAAFCDHEAVRFMYAEGASRFVLGKG